MKVAVALIVCSVLVGFYQSNTPTALVKSGETGGDVINLSFNDLAYKCSEFKDYYTVTGLSQEWQGNNPGDPENKPRLSIKIPAYYDDGENGILSVSGIGGSAFCMDSGIPGGITDYAIVKVDFSAASTLTSIGVMAFRKCEFTEIDLSTTMMFWISDNAFSLCESLRSINLGGLLLAGISSFAFYGCRSLETIDLRLERQTSVYKDAFKFCDSLKTIYLGYHNESGCQIPVFNDDPSFEHVENIVFSCSDCTLLAADSEDLSNYVGKFTFEQEVTFDPNGGDGEECTITKLYNRSFDYIKTGNGAWVRNSGYTLPSPGIRDGYSYQWTADTSGVLINAGSMVVENRYTAVWTLIPPPPPPVEPEFPALAAWLIGIGGFVALIGAGAWVYRSCRKCRPVLCTDTGYLTAAEVTGLRAMLAEKNKAPLPLPEILTLRERDVALLLLSGKKRKEIADELCIALNTAKEHIHNILDKSECANQLEFVIKYGQ